MEYVIQAVGNVKDLVNPYVSQDYGMTTNINFARRYNTRREARLIKNAFRSYDKVSFRVVKVITETKVQKVNP